MSAFFDVWVETYFLEGDQAQPLVSKQNLLAMAEVKKNTGVAVDEPFVLSGARNSATTYAKAVTKSTTGTRGNSSNNHRWLVPLGELDGRIIVKDRDLAASQGDTARADAMKHEIKLGVARFGYDLATRFGGERGGAIGFGTYATSGHVLTLEDPSQARNFSQGQIVDISETDGTSAGTLFAQRSIVSVDADAGTLVLGATTNDTVAANPSSTLQNTDPYYLFDGYTYEDTDGDPTAVMLGASDVVPLTTPTSTLAGVVRAEDSRLGGIRLTSAEAAAASTLMDRIITLSAKGEEQGGWMYSDERVAVLGSVAFGVLLRQMAQLGMPQNPSRRGKTGEYGYSSVEVHTGQGTVTCVSDRTCPKGIMRLLDFSKIKVHTPTGKLTDFVRSNGSFMSQLADGTNDHIIRPVYYGMVSWGNPAHHGIAPTGL